MPESQFDFIAKMLAWFAGISGTLFGAGKYHSTIAKKKELYNPDGSLIYVPAKDAEKCKDECIKMINDVSKDNKEKWDKIVAHMTNQNTEMMKISEFMGGVKQYMKNNK
jgi:hypothetical protein